MGKDDLNIDIEGNILDEEQEFQRLIKSAFLRGQRVVLENLLTYIDKETEKYMVCNKTDISNIIYTNLKSIILNSIAQLELAENINGKIIMRGDG